MLSIVSVAAVAASAVWPNLCVDSGNAYNSTRCDAEGTCCPSPFSMSGKGCCPYANAVCCPNNEYTCCPEGSTCVTRTGTGFRAISDCFKGGKNLTMASSVCKPGPHLEPSQTLKNVIVLGDSVSIGYTPVLAGKISDIALVRHTPWDTRDGGAEETAYGLKCLKYFLHSPSGVPVAPDVLMFNFGLHDGPLGNETLPGQQGNTSVYPGQLSQIADAIKEALPSTKIVFALTTPMVCKLSSDYNVQYLNKKATEIMTARDIEVVDFHTPIANECGPIPQPSCFNITNCFCPHCPGAGYEFLVNSTIEPFMRKLLQ